jgi:MFS family permease
MGAGRLRRSELPAGVRTLQAGLVVNTFGNGAVAPFLIIYLHDVRHVPLPVAGVASAVAAVVALAATLAAGRLADRIGMRTTMTGGLALSTVAYALYPLVRLPWHAIGLAGLAGAGIGTWLTMQSALLAAMTPPALRHIAFAWQRVAANVGLGLGGFAAGLLVTTSRPATFTALFWLNATTFVVYALFLARIPLVRVSRIGPGPSGGYRAVISDRLFLRLTALNFMVVAGAIALLNALLPVFAKDEAGVSEATIGVLFLVNSAAIIGLQLPVARFLEGRSRLGSFALMAMMFAISWGLVAATPSLTSGVVVLLAAIGVFSVAECVYDAVQGPLVADLAPPELLVRYLAVMAFSWQLGFIVGPAVGAAALAYHPLLAWLIAAVVCAGAAVLALRLDRLLPARVRTTPVRQSGAVAPS